jgi:hypothetical protein
MKPRWSVFSKKANQLERENPLEKTFDLEYQISDRAALVRK